VSVTLYQQIAQDLVGKVRSGELPPGSQLPTEMQLMEVSNPITAQSDAFIRNMIDAAMDS